jgi:hypothetical protein
MGACNTFFKVLPFDRKSPPLFAQEGAFLVFGAANQPTKTPSVYPVACDTPKLILNNSVGGCLAIECFRWDCFRFV